jgi:Flp pilus assembly protein TadG
MLPFLLLLVIGVVDFGRAFYDSIELENAARAGAQYGAINPTDTAGMIAAAKSDASTDISSVTATASYGCMCSDGTGVSANCATAPSCSSSTRQVNYVQVNTSYTYSTFFPWPGVPSSFALTGNATLSPGE